MNHKYAHILSPVQIGNVFLKNRLMVSKSVSQELQGPEPFPAEATISYLEQYARNGAAIVTCPIGSWPEDRIDNTFVSKFEMEDRRVLNYFGQMTRRIHNHNSLAIGNLSCAIPQKYAISERRHPEWVLKPLMGPDGNFFPDGSPKPPKPEITKEQIACFISSFAAKCAVLKALGFDGVNVYMSYNGSILAHSLSPVLNQRVDEYGGSLENRARLTLELYRAVKAACGQDFLIECQISGEEDMPNGYSLEDFLSYAKLCEGLVDIFQIRAKSGTLSHPTSFSCPEHFPRTLHYAQAFKQRGIKALCAPIGGFQNLDDIERFIAEGKTDMVAMARAFICDSQYGQKLYEGRGEDVVPCIRCDKCHGSVCSVNPSVGLGHVIQQSYPARPYHEKKVAVIGGGPAGLSAALEAAWRGHQVTVYESRPYLGGQLMHVDYMPGKWALKNYKDYLIAQLQKTDAVLLLNTKATPELIRQGNFDAVIAACGSRPKLPPVPGGDDVRIWKPIECFGREGELGLNVTVIGGASTGSETALYLADSGHKVTLVTRRERICHDDVSHGGEYLHHMMEHHPNITVMTSTATLSIANGTDATLQGPDGTVFVVTADCLVFSSGVEPMTQESAKFAGLTPEFYVIGDANIHNDALWCTFHFPAKAEVVGGDIKHCTATAYAAAMSL
ncbi:MAG: FAD-dependent oxidoreductase [Oscillospiraceae bacterium]|nr:FAD-dependent oxidoreductase [Oscillospiraceae bacterium]